jgi:hypothetical protein
VEQVKAEKLLLESTLESLKAKHLEELQLLEDSYRYCTFTATQIPSSCTSENTCIIVSLYSTVPRDLQWMLMNGTLPAFEDPSLTTTTTTTTTAAAAAATAAAVVPFYSCPHSSPPPPLPSSSSVPPPPLNIFFFPCFFLHNIFL